MARRTEPVSIWAEAELSYAASCLTGLLVLRVFVVALFSHFAHFSCNKGTSSFFFCPGKGANSE